MLRSILFLLKPLWHAAVELLFYAPIWLTLGIYTLSPNQLPLFSLLLLVIYCIPQLVFHSGKSIKNGWRLLLTLLLGIFPIVLLSQLFPEHVGALSWLACGAIGIAFVQSSFASLKNGWHNSFSSVFMLVMIVAALALQLLKVMVLKELATYNTIYFTFGIAACVLFLYINNERSIRSQQMIDGTSATIRRSVAMNRLYISIITLLVAAIALFRNVQEQLEQWFKGLYQALLAWLFREREQQTTPPAEQPQATMPPMDQFGEEGEPSAFWLLLEQIVKWLAICLIVVGVIAAIYYLVAKLIPMLLAYIHRMLNHRALLKQSNDGYQDEIEGIAPQKSKARRERKRAEKAVSLRQWDKLSNVQKLKVLYVQALNYGLRRGEPISASNTAQQNLQLLMKDSTTSELYGKLSSDYNSMRYGDKEPDNVQLEKLREGIEGEKKRQQKESK